jgi:predicted DNA-binding transcriptional regulator AlpA
MEIKDRTNDRALRMSSVCQKTGMGPSWVYDEIASGRFPPGFKITKKSRAWWESDVTENLLARERGEINYDDEAAA